MLNEINKDYFDSVRKSILDYILKDENEMKRLGIQQVVNKPISWGEDYYKGIEPDEYWKHNVMMARMLMSETLCICSQATLELLRVWRDNEYNSTLLVDLLKPEDPPITLEQFLQNQNQQIESVRHLLNRDWKDRAVEILREELENLDRDQTQTFFDSVSTLMSNQARELATNSINEYVEFFRRFKKPDGKYPLPEEIIRREYGPDDEFEKTFLTLKIEVQGDQIKFQRDLSSVKEDLVKVIQQMVKAIDQIPRADTQIANSDKTHLWEIRQDDEIVINARNEINQILFENLQIAAKAVNVYDEYLFILKEPEKVAEFMAGTRNKDLYIQRIRVYQDTIAKIKRAAPYEIRMSMFLIQCHELNNRLIHECEKLIDSIVKRIYDVNNEEASFIIQEVKRIQEAFQVPAKESHELVQFEADCEEVRTKRRAEIQKRYHDLVEWVELMYDYPQFEVNDEIQKQVKSAYGQVCRIASSIEDRSAALSNQRREIEQRLMSESKDFSAELNELKQQIDAFKDKVNQKQHVEFNQQIEQLKKQLSQMTEKQQQINKKQADLEFNIEEFPILEQCKKNIKPFEEFWKTYSETMKYSAEWNQTPVNELVADEIQSTFKKLLAVMNRMETQFQQMRLKKHETFAKSSKDNLMKFQKKIPVIRALTTKGLKESHISKMSKKLGLPEKTDCTKQSLENLAGAESHIQFLEAEAEFAFRQYTLYNNLQDMKAAWGPLNFDTIEWKGVSYILTGDTVEQLTEKLDDHIIKTQSMRGSPFI